MALGTREDNDQQSYALDSNGNTTKRVTISEVKSSDHSGGSRSLSISATKMGTKAGQDTNIIGPTTVFGEVLVAEVTPVVQIDAVLGLRTKTDVTTSISASGVADVLDNIPGQEFRASTGTNSAGYAKITSKNSIRYRAGQGVLYRLTGKFSTPAANSSQRVGAMNIGNEYTFGYNGTSFGILYRKGGRQESRRLTITGAATGNGNVTITLNGVAFVVAVTTGTTSHNSFEIASATYTGWDCYQNDGKNLFVSQSVGAKNGTYSFDAGATGMTASFSLVSSGVSPTDQWINQADWNGYTLLSTSTSPFVLNQLKGNVYQVKTQYLGYGVITFQIEDPETGLFVDVHTVRYSNSNTAPNLDYPVMQLGIVVENLGNTSNLAVHSASMAGFIEGYTTAFRNSISRINSKASIGTTLTNILSLRVRKDFLGRINYSEIGIKFIDSAAEGNKPAEVYLYKNATLAGEPNWTYHDENHSIVEYDTSGTTVTENSNTISLLTHALAKSSSEHIQYPEGIGLKAQPGDIITLAIRATSTTVDATGSIGWIED